VVVQEARSGLLRRTIGALSLIGFLVAALNYWAAGVAASSFPPATDFPGWIALFQPQQQVAADVKVGLRVHPLVPGGPGSRPLIEVVVTACGQGRFDGELLLAGDAGVVDAGSAYASGVRLDTMRTAVLEDSGSGARADLAGARRVRFGGELAQKCVSGGQIGEVLLRFVARLGHPTVLQKRTLWFDSVRQVQSWPMLGTVSAFNTRSLGAFKGTGDFEGTWIRPRALSIELGVATLGASALVDTSSPPLADSDNAHWEQTTWGIHRSLVIMGFGGVGT
jgi:hypothetical protein